MLCGGKTKASVLAHFHHAGAQKEARRNKGYKTGLCSNTSMLLELCASFVYPRTTSEQMPSKGTGLLLKDKLLGF